VGYTWNQASAADSRGSCRGREGNFFACDSTALCLGASPAGTCWAGGEGAWALSVGMEKGRLENEAEGLTPVLSISPKPLTLGAPWGQGLHLLRGQKWLADSRHWDYSMNGSKKRRNCEGPNGPSSQLHILPGLFPPHSWAPQVSVDLTQVKPIRELPGLATVAM
jgi:hypothetical protein